MRLLSDKEDLKKSFFTLNNIYFISTFSNSLWNNRKVNADLNCKGTKSTNTLGTQSPALHTTPSLPSSPSMELTESSTAGEQLFYDVASEFY